MGASVGAHFLRTGVVRAEHHVGATSKREEIAIFHFFFNSLTPRPPRLTNLPIAKWRANRGACVSRERDRTVRDAAQPAPPEPELVL